MEGVGNYSRWSWFDGHELPCSSFRARGGTIAATLGHVAAPVFHESHSSLGASFVRSF
jgi:hypothetical protein